MTIPGALELLLAGLLGSFHCVGMCGGFVLLVQAPGGVRREQCVRQALFHVGKTGTYVLLGAIVGILGTAFLRAAWFDAARALLGALAGLLMILAGLQISGVLREFPVGRIFGPGSLYDRAVRGVLNVRGAGGPMALGVLTGFLPCPLIYAFLAAALGTGSVLGAMGTMASLGLASMPALVAVVWLGSRWGPVGRARAVRVAGAVVVVLGLVTFVRAAFPDLLHGHGHTHAGEAAA